MEDETKDRQEGIVIDEGTERNDQVSPEVTREEYDELYGKYLRLAADFDNYRKRSARDQERIIQFANERFALEILDVLDNFERALKADDADLRAGLVQIHKLFLSVLERNGITQIRSEDAPFDPEKHEAIAYLPSQKEEGIILDEVCRGYCMHDKVIRCAKVAVSKGNKQ
ncbi:molecular chaperone GrpE [Methanocalculus chunghsingensis]|uniref:Protein GrpE n=1 Tax=Methanocalculus chunghsingensis TaxID=156457 RepID=A0A8J8B4L7_9EURY|nr:nucleotide exchange factor GrpE [Methanocalculus chunghsingensis]MBR1368169.1 molecular chaperone GrpE [Methanocalculus chunghsingensis]